MKEKTWKIKEGKTLLISDMSTEHLINSINFMKEKGGISRSN